MEVYEFNHRKTKSSGRLRFAFIQTKIGGVAAMAAKPVARRNEKEKIFLILPFSFYRHPEYATLRPPAPPSVTIGKWARHRHGCNNSFNLRDKRYTERLSNGDRVAAPRYGQDFHHFPNLMLRSTRKIKSSSPPYKPNSIHRHK
ncbi:hypothetical protein L1887_38400 [Cichorium endivia]|nr:hypothetical protein L1887_38400 [Cichorium endivia]